MVILTDTNILIRLKMPAALAHREVSSAVRILRRVGHRLVMTAQGAAEFWNVCTRPASARGGYGLSRVETDTRLRRLERLFPLQYDSDDSYFHWRRLIVANCVQGVKVHDARIAALMLANGITHILTYNGRDFTRFPGIVALSPADVVAGVVPSV
jgi:predicted nucleic acid-binding protein